MGPLQAVLVGPTRGVLTTRREQAGNTAAAVPVPHLIMSPSGGAVEFETVISAAGVLSVLPRAQRLKLGPALAGQVARVWADEGTVHVLIGGQRSSRWTRN